MMDRIHYWLGRISKRYRLRYYRRTFGQWMWGLLRFVDDVPPSLTPDDSVGMHELTSLKMDQILEVVMDAYEKVP